jgi:adenosylhomocysteine nucleosidase
MKKLPALVCFALKEEAGSFQKYANNSSVSFLITGIGRENAGKAMHRFLERNSPKQVITCGFAGGLNPDLKTGDVVFEIFPDRRRGDGSQTETKSETPHAVSYKQMVAAGAKPAKFFCAPKVATTAVEKQELRRTTGADAVEMESEVIHAVCRERGIPCATVRVISDTASEDLPLDFNELSNADLSLNFGKLVLAIAKSPGKIPALLRLQKNCKLAAERLAAILLKVIATDSPSP